MSNAILSSRTLTLSILSVIFYALLFVPVADAASLKLSPSTGIYTAGKSFTISVALNTDGKSVNAADGKLTFNPKELQVVSVSRASSIFNLWTEEPSFSNTQGTIAFGGGSPTGYKGTSGAILNITFRTLGAGTPKVTFANGSALAADGLGTNVLTAMNGGTYTVAAESDSPAPEYIPPANTPKAPVVTSSTHPDQGGWYKEKSAVLSWELPSDVTAVRMLLDENEGTVPTKVYDERIDEKAVDDLEEGTSFFHLQFKNAEGWGRIAHYQINVDSESPKDFKISKAESDDQNSPKKVLAFEYVDVSPIVKYNIQIDGATPLEYKDSDNSKKYTLESLSPGTHTIVVEVVDSAGNSSVGTLTFTIDAFEKPVFIEYPSRINTEVIPAIKGKTRPNATVTVSVKRAQDADIASADYDSEARTYTAKSDALGEFIFIPDSPFAQGVYVLQATAEDAYGSVSEPSDEIRLIVEIPGYLALGTTVISVLSVVVPVVGLIVLLVFGTWYLWHRLSLWKRKVLKETREAEDMLVSEFAHLISELNLHVEKLKTARKSKLTKAEAELISQIESDIKDAEKRVSKEIEDIEKVIT